MTVNGSPQGEVHADMSHSTEDDNATRVNLDYAADPCDQGETDNGPYRI